MHDISRLRRQELALVAGSLMLMVGTAVRSAERAHASIDAPDLRLGDKWLYQCVDGYRQKTTWDEMHEITAIGPGGITATVTAHGAAVDFTRTEVWAAPGVVRSGAIYESETDRFDPPLIRYRFPITSGATWSQRLRDLNKSPGPYGAISFKATVRGYESVTTGAGTFDAIRIRYVMQLDDETVSRLPTQCDHVVWYAASVAAMVRAHRRSYSILKGGASSPRVPGQNAVYALTSFARGA